MLSQFDLLSADVESANHLTAEAIILGLGLYSPPVNSLWKQKSAMRRGIKKPCGSKVRCYAAILIDLNENLDSFPGAKLTEKLV